MSTWDAKELTEAYRLLGPENMNLLKDVCTDYNHSVGKLYYGTQVVMADNRVLSINQAHQYTNDGGELTPADAFTDDIATQLERASHFVAGCFTEGKWTLFIWGILEK